LAVSSSGAEACVALYLLYTPFSSAAGEAERCKVQKPEPPTVLPHNTPTFAACLLARRELSWAAATERLLAAASLHLCIFPILLLLCLRC
jgi:hypothetical protein